MLMLHLETVFVTRAQPTPWMKEQVVVLITTTMRLERGMTHHKAAPILTTSKSRIMLQIISIARTLR